MRDRAQKEAESAGMVNENSLGAAVAAMGDSGLDLGGGDDGIDMGMAIGIGSLGDDLGAAVGLATEGLGEPSTLAEVGGKGKDASRKHANDLGDESRDIKRPKLEGQGQGQEDGLGGLSLDPTIDPALAALSQGHLDVQVDVDDGAEEEEDTLGGLVGDEVDFQALERLGQGVDGEEVDFQALERLERHFAQHHGEVELGDIEGAGEEGYSNVM
jgi:hypothetical protein